MRIEIVDDLAGLRALAPAWGDAWSASTGRLFQSHAWIEAWAAVAIGPRRRLRITRIEDDGGCAILPLMQQSRLGVRRLRWLGAEVTDYCDLLETGTPLPFSAATLEQLCRGADLVELSQIRPGAAAERVLANRIGPASSEIDCPWIDLAIDRPPSDILRAERKASSEAQLDHRIAAGPTERRAVVERVVAFKRETLSRQRLDTRTLNSLVAPFLRRLADMEFPVGSEPCFSTLDRAGEPIAAQISFVEGATLLYYYPAYDQRFRPLSPGHLLLLALYRFAKARGLETIDLLRGREPYKFKWSRRVESLKSATWAQSSAGRVFRTIGEALHRG